MPEGDLNDLQAVLGAPGGGMLGGAGPNAAQPPPPPGDSLNIPPPQNLPQIPNNTYSPPSGPPHPGMPLIYEFAKAMIQGEKGGPQGLQPVGTPRPPSRLDAFESFIGNFLNSFATGMQQGGTGPGAFGRGMGAAMQAPYQRQLQQYQLGQQQQAQNAENELKRSQAQLAESQSQLVDTPWGKMPAKLASAIMGQYVKGGQAADTAATSRENVAETKGEFDLKKAAITAAGKAPTELQLIGRSLHGDADAEAQLKTLQDRRLQLVQERNKGMQQRPLFQLQKVIDPETGQLTMVTGAEFLRAKEEGKNYIPSGPLSQKEIISVQQLQSEAAPAIKAVRDNISAFDDAGDRAIFARILHDAGTPSRGNEASWMGSVINQATQSGLSDKGRMEAQSLGRLAETMGRLRSTLGLPATDQSMAVTLSLLPGRSTGSSKYASGQVDQLEQMIQQAVGIPALRGVAGGGGTNTPNKAKSKVDTLAQKYGGVKP